MSSLMVSNDLDIMMLELAVDKLFIPKKSVFDAVIMKKITVMFRMLDCDWTSLNPQREDYVPYQGSSLEETFFNGGKSVVFAIPSGSLKMRIKGVDVQIHVIREVSKYFEVKPSEERENVGLVLANVDVLFNGIINELREREELKEYLSCFHEREPISRSLKETYAILDENQRDTGANIGIYVRLSYFGKSVITEIERDPDIPGGFYAQEETNERGPYQCRELKRSELEGGRWDSETLGCQCDKRDVLDKDDDNGPEKNRGHDASSTRIVEEDVEDEKKNGKGKGKGRLVGKGRESIEKRVRKSSGDRSQPRGKRSPKTRRKKEKSTRIGKSDEEKGRKSKGDSGRAATRVSKTLGTRGSSEGPTGQKQRTTSASKDKREVRREKTRDRKTMRKLDNAPVTTQVVPEKKDDAAQSRSSNEYAKLLKELRKRRGGNVTVGIHDKKGQSFCQEATMSTQRTSSTCPEQDASISSPFCTKMCYSSACYYPRSCACNAPSITLNHGCFFDSRVQDLCSSLRQNNIPEMQVVTI